MNAVSRLAGKVDGAQVCRHLDPSSLCHWAPVRGLAPAASRVPFFRRRKGMVSPGWRDTVSSSPSTMRPEAIASRPMRHLGPYGEMAARHMRTWRPQQYASIPYAEREEYFRALDEAVAQAIRVREHSLMPSRSLAQTDHEGYAAQLSMSRLVAEEAVLAEMVYLPPEDDVLAQMAEPATDSSGAYLDRGWRSPRVELTDEEWEQKQSAEAWTPKVQPPSPAPPL